MRTGLVLGAGGYVGQAFHLGVLTALAEAGWDARQAEVLVGTSAGSLVAAALAAGLSAPDQRAHLLGEPLSAQGRALRDRARGRVPTMPAPPAPPARGPLALSALGAAVRRPWAVRPGAVAAGLLPAGRTSTGGIVRSIAPLFPDGWPSRDLRVCAVRARDGVRVAFGAPGAPPADVGSAVAASCAIPAYFAPVAVGDERYVDGGVHSPSNADVLLPDGLDLVLVSSPMSCGPGGARRPAVDLALRVAVRRYLAGEVRRLRAAGTTVVVVQPTPEDLAVMGPNPMQGARVREVVASAAGSTRRRLARGGTLAAAVAA